MKSLIIIIVACILASCSMATHCPTYIGAKKSVSHHKKSQPHFAKHNKPRKTLF